MKSFTKNEKFFLVEDVYCWVGCHILRFLLLQVIQKYVDDHDEKDEIFVKENLACTSWNTKALHQKCVMIFK